MMFTVFHHQKEIGRSALEQGDPPMGCAEGEFHPSNGFAAFRANVMPQSDDDPRIKRWIGLSVRKPEGSEIECMDAVLFEYDFGDHKALKVDVLGIPFPLYEELFPGRYAEYEASFSK